MDPTYNAQHHYDDDDDDVLQLWFAGAQKHVAPKLEPTSKPGEPMVYKVTMPDSSELLFHDPAKVVEQVEHWLKGVLYDWRQAAFDNNIKPCYIRGPLKVMLLGVVLIEGAWIQPRLLVRQPYACGSDHTGTPPARLGM
jgi:hypothetical protein